KLGQYKELPVTRRILDISDQDVDEEIEKQRRRMTKLVDAEPEAKAELGDTVSIDFRGLKDDVAFEGGTAEDYPLEIGSHSFIPGFEEQLVGVMAGEEKRVEVSFPEGYPAEELAGQPVVFEVKVRGIKRKQLPELDQEFVEEVSETAENIDQLKTEIRNRLMEESMHMAVDSAHNSAILSAVAACEVELPPIMIEQEIDQMIEENKQQLAGRGLTMDKYLEYMGLSEEKLREEMRPQAEFSIKRSLMLNAIIEAENIEISDEEVDEKISETARHYYVTEQQIRDSLGDGERLEDFKHEIKRMKAADLVYDHAVITDEHIDREELAAKMAEQAAAQAAEEKDRDDAEAPAEAEGEEEGKIEA
ncbi:MAG: trigger factor, partial [Clostridia bacterium]|nr:trigger factor [Clostridia bacterium]